ncbi:shikimate dehydrogenase [Rubellimicrobium aerolatum]|uniref:Shikimate dehydrogenase (NADP(+)) n=1 Tax=Rubellimicrobium aerolatum TaxID=490979 RepID=A0ABW0SA54_9RHOB|nr:shikimate dehydrogenase [Rubellimicrobium aerolatum]MBP1805146.1 shikimate dehydrogenase [Rubellimicrobium aerolatum]
MSSSFPLAGVVGRPVTHSRSPKLHRHWLARHGIAGDYVAMDVGEADLAEVLRALPKAGFRGVNVTIPHKAAALALADEATERARRIGAANLLVFEDGRILADNTDGEGFLESLRQGAPEWDAGAGPATVLGAGGAARAVIVALLDAGAPEVLLTNRTRENADALAGEFGERVRVFDWVQAGNAVEEGRMIVNTTSLGMVGKPGLRVPLDGLRQGQVVMDLVYAPLETRLLREARAAGAVAVDGLGMLLHQAVPAFARWFGVRPEVDDALRAAVMA